MAKIKRLIYYLIHPSNFIKRLVELRLSIPERALKPITDHEKKRYLRYAGILNSSSQENLIARIIHTYHGIEKGLTMPNRRLNFGEENIISLVNLINEYIERYDTPTSQVKHAIGVLKAYQLMHKEVEGEKNNNHHFWETIHQLIDKYPNIPPSIQSHVTADEFYSEIHSDFEKFARARHTTRHYTGHVSRDEIQKAVELAMTAPSACNRQPVRVHCITDKDQKEKILSLQSGNRGFGSDADTILIITGDLSDICWIEERYDIYTNCGIFIMNLCYALFYYKIAHCILNWSIGIDPGKDKKLHEIGGIPDNEVVAAMISCGKAPEEFDVASSPRRELAEILKFH